jgi:hypothetical protein
MSRTDTLTFRDNDDDTDAEFHAASPTAHLLDDSSSAAIAPAATSPIRVLSLSLRAPKASSPPPSRR